MFLTTNRTETHAEIRRRINYGMIVTQFENCYKPAYFQDDDDLGMQHNFVTRFL
jgi:hypothetical protein